MSTYSAFKTGPKTVTVLGGSNGYSNPAFSGSLGYGDSKTFSFDGYLGTYMVAVSPAGVVSVSSDTQGPIGYVGAFVDLGGRAAGQISSAASGFDSANLTARVGQSLSSGEYASTSLGSNLHPPALGFPNPFVFP